MLYFSCTEEESLKRMLQRGIDSGRSDDNHESALKRLETYQKESVPIITMYQKLGIVHRIDTNRRKEETFAEIDDLFAKKGFLSEN